MNVLDIILIAAMVLFTARGLLRGIVKEFVSLGSVLLGILLASKLHHTIEPYLAIHIENPVSVQAAAYLVIFLATVGVVWLLAKVVRDVFKFELTGWIDHALGAAFGLAEGFLLSCVGLLMLATFLPQATFLRESTLAPRTEPVIRLLADFMPQSLIESMEEAGFTPPGQDEDTQEGNQTTNSPTIR